MESKFCPMTNRLYMMAHEELGRSLIKRKFGTLNILTLGDDFIFGFACEGHPDVYDWFGTVDDIGEKINSYVEEVREFNMKRYKDITEINSAILNKKRKRSICQLDNVLDIYIENAYMIRHMNMLHDLQTEKGWYEKPTTCGYNFFDWRTNKSADEKNYAFFLHTALSVAVELDTDIFNWFWSARHIHQTAVPIIHFERTDHIVFNDNCRNILAWGGGTTSRTTQSNRRQFYIKHRGEGWNNLNLRVTTQRFTRFIIENLRNPQMPNFLRDANAADIDLEDIIHR